MMYLTFLISKLICVLLMALHFGLLLIFAMLPNLFLNAELMYVIFVMALIVPNCHSLNMPVNANPLYFQDSRLSRSMNWMTFSGAWAWLICSTLGKQISLGWYQEPSMWMRWYCQNYSHKMFERFQGDPKGNDWSWRGRNNGSSCYCYKNEQKQKEQKAKSYPVHRGPSVPLLPARPWDRDASLPREDCGPNQKGLICCQ